MVKLSKIQNRSDHSELTAFVNLC